MRWYHWFFIVSLQVFINLGMLFLVFSQIKVVSFMRISSMDVDKIAKALQAGEDLEKLKAMQLERIKQVEKRIARERGIVLLKECVVKSPFKDITDEVIK